MLWTALAAFSVSCSEDGALSPSPRGEVELELVGRRLVVKSEAPVENEPLPAGLKVGVFATVVPYGMASAINDEFTVNAEGQLIGAPILLSSEWNYRICAYAPYREKKVTYDTDTLTFFHGEDILQACVSLSDVSPTNRTACLSFTHCTARIAFTLAVDPSCPWIDTEKASLAVRGFYPSGSFIPQTGKVVPAKSLDNDIKITDKDGTQTCFIPGEGPQELDVEVSFPQWNGSKIIYSTKINRLFQKGMTYKYQILVKDNSGLQVGGGTVPWVEVPDEDVVVENGTA